jgi:formylglycine-generating enzyme required for sulfatase activity
MHDRLVIRLAWVLAVSGLAGVLVNAGAVQQAAEPPGNGVKPFPKAVESPKPLAGTPRKQAERSKKGAKGPKGRTNSIGMRFALVPADEFRMGTPDWDRDGEPDERPQHRVRITRSFFLGICEVTQQEYERVTGKNPSSEQDSPQQPVETVSWFDAVEFCNRLSTLEKVPPYYDISDKTVTIRGGNGYRLPTEAEWEYACRAGSTTKWSCGDDAQQLVQYAWFEGSADGQSRHTVGEKFPNAFGLYDMHGHKWEWCWDRYGEDYYQHSPVDDPQGPDTGSLRIERGGGWNNEPPRLRSAYRNHLTPTSRFRDLGFRVAMTGGDPSLAKNATNGEKANSPADILSQRGLECLRGTPQTWILREEVAVLGRFRLARDQEAQLSWGRAQRRELAEGSQSRQAFRAACQTQIDTLDNKITEIDRVLDQNPFFGTGIAANYHNLLVQEHNALVSERRRLGTMMSSFYQQGGDLQGQLRQFGNDLESLEKSHRQTVAELRDSVAEITKRYDELGADKEIAKALSELPTTRKVKQILGPSRLLKDAIKAVTHAVGGDQAGTPTDQGRKKQ